MSEGNGFTPTHKRILALLSDGMPHTKEEVHRCLWDEESQISAIRYHISTLRAKLPPGQDIIARWLNNRSLYQHVRLLNDEE